MNERPLEALLSIKRQGDAVKGCLLAILKSERKAVGFR